MEEFTDQQMRFAANGKVGLWRFKWSGADEQDLEVIAHHELPQVTAHFSQWYSDLLRDIQQKVRKKELFCSKSPVSSHFLFLSCSDPGCTEHCCNLSNQKFCIA